MNASLRRWPISAALEHADRPRGFAPGDQAHRLLSKSFAAKISTAKISAAKISAAKCRADRPQGP
jgi:hypothetical protein